jgi:glyoxylate/hydroxypyruvate reductase
VATLALLMAQAQFPALLQAQREARWDQRLTPRAAKTRVLIAGLGTIGGAAARAATALGMQVTGLRRTRAPHSDTHRLIQRHDLAAALADTDILFAALPATDETRGLFGEGLLACLPVTATVISLGRAACLDLEALTAALDRGRLAGAIIDGFPQEPLPPTSNLWTTRNLVVLPHIAGGDATAFTDASLDILFDNLGRLARGDRLRNVIEPGLGY